LQVACTAIYIDKDRFRGAGDCNSRFRRSVEIDTRFRESEMSAGVKTAQGSTRIVAFSLAVLFVLFFAQVATHTHENGQNEGSCQVCQGAHIAPAPMTSTLAPDSLIAFESVRPGSITFQQDVFFDDRLSRAPPRIALYFR
jgi:hypothetical protein